jgi:hypothetical protein
MQMRRSGGRLTHEHHPGSRTLAVRNGRDATPAVQVATATVQNATRCDAGSAGSQA